MSAPTVRLDHAALASIGKAFLRESVRTQASLKRMTQSVETLRAGDWIGKGASAFFDEMESEVLPRMQRLESALAQAGQLTRQVSQLMRQAERDAAALFRYHGLGQAVGGVGGAALLNSVFQPDSPFGDVRIVQAYAVSGPWGIGSPVHEVLTLSALRLSLEAVPPGERGELLKGVELGSLPKLDSEGAYDLNTKKIDPSAQQFIRGVVWPDDPKGYLFDDPRTTENYSSGARWWEEFDQDERNDPAALIARSHYGDLQFFHGMSSELGESPRATKAKMLQWSRFLTDVSTGRIDPDVKLAEVGLTNELFPAHRDATIKELFAYPGASDLEARQRAAGALTHMIQDSYAGGHVDRDPQTGAIREFHNYGAQAGDLHAHQDEWGQGRTLGDRFQSTQGAQAAYEQSSRVLVMLDQGVDTDRVVRYLDQQVFPLDPGARPSGPGEQFAPQQPGSTRA